MPMYAAPIPLRPDEDGPHTLSETLRGQRMLSRWTLKGHPVTFSWVEVWLALWKASWLPGYFLSSNYTVSVTILSDYTGGSVPPGVFASLIGGTGMLHVFIMALAWFGIARPPRTLRLSLNLAGSIVYAFIAGVAIGIGVYTTAGPYLVFTFLALGNLQRAVRNGRGYRAVA